MAVNFFQNGRQNIHDLLSQSLIDLEKNFWCLTLSKYTLSGPRITQKTITNLIFLPQW